MLETSKEHSPSKKDISIMEKFNEDGSAQCSVGESKSWKYCWIEKKHGNGDFSVKTILNFLKIQKIIYLQFPFPELKFFSVKLSWIVFLTAHSTPVSCDLAVAITSANPNWHRRTGDYIGIGDYIDEPAITKGELVITSANIGYLYGE